MTKSAYRLRLILGLLVSFNIWIPFASAHGLCINEIMASNATTIWDEDGDASDWIEIYHAGNEPLNLRGYGLSDDRDRPFRWVFPDIFIRPGEFLLLWASGKDRTDPGGPLHANFSMASAGEVLILTAPDRSETDAVSPVGIPTGISLGRQPDGSEGWFFFREPTPGAPNVTEAYREVLEPVTFSPPGGFYDTPLFQVALHHPDPGVTILYTIDGSEPHPDNLDGKTYQYKNRYRRNAFDTDGTFSNIAYRTDVYEGPIGIRDRTIDPNRVSRRMATYDNSTAPFYFPSNPVFKGTVIRAMAVKEGTIPARTVTHTYFVTPQSRARYSHPVVSIVMQEADLFDYEAGIYVPGMVYDEWRSSNWGSPDGSTPANYNRRGVEWERRASFEIFEEGTAFAAVRQDIGVRTHGGWSRSDPMKSLRLYARNEYGESRFFHNIFPGLPYGEYNRLLLRNSGNDRQYTLFRDAAIQRVVGHMNFDVQAYRPAVVFLNGEYWGIHNFRERFDRHYLARVYGVDPDRVDLLEGNASVKEGSNRHYEETIRYIEENRLADEEHYAYIRTRIDIDNFMDYQIAQIYSGNTDWPGNNIDFWRYQTDDYQPDAPSGHDGRWRWLMYDTDFGFGLYGRNPNVNNIASATAPNGPSWPNPPWSTLLLRRFLENESFRHAFINRFADQLNTAFHPDRVHAVIRDMADVLRPGIAEHIARWKQPGSENDWDNQIDVMLQYTSDRPGFVREHIRRMFNIRGLVDLTVDIADPSMGKIRVNTLEIGPSTPGIGPHPFPWTGTYFQNIPVTLEARPFAGYVFSHWEGLPVPTPSPGIALRLTDATTVTAVFEPCDNSGLLPRPFHLGDGSYVFEAWSADRPAGTYPGHMVFVYMDREDPGPDADIAGLTGGAYNLDARTRINGLDENGFAFINTSGETDNPGYPHTRLGGAVVALDTRGRKEIDVTWEGMTVRPNSRAYNIRLQYRLGNEDPFRDVTGPDGKPVEYKRNGTAGHREQIGPVRLPREADNKACVQLLWRYYYTGVQLDSESGQRSQMGVSRIVIDAKGEVSSVSGRDGGTIPGRFVLYPNHPNPFNPSTRIRFELPEETDVWLTVHDVTGRRVVTLIDGRLGAGGHTVTFDAADLAGGIYVYRIRAGDRSAGGRMLYLK
ncbi:MAG TPA: T9SS type A sorting domain-containing protein [bacterium]|nr:T9SS type A sorting domain-containing protein [bacterium]